MKKRTPLTGKPDFSSVSDERLREYRDLTQQMLFTYQHCDAEKVRVLTEVWQELSDECTERLCNAPFVQPVEESSPKIVHKIKTIKCIKR